jgi:hypothetical protein
MSLQIHTLFFNNNSYYFLFNFIQIASFQHINSPYYD